MHEFPHLSQWQDYGLGGDDTGTQEPEDWRMYGIPEYGAYSEMLGVISGDEIPPIAIEVDQGLYGNQVLARTPMLDLTPKDYNYIKLLRKPYAGMLGLGDDGMVYEYDDTLGFFTKIYKAAKSAVKSVGRRIKKGASSLLKRIPGGKYLIKLGKKIHKIASKLVKPLTKFVGKYAAKLAPVAALIPGYGPAIAAGLYTAGKIANLMNKYGVVVKGAKGAVRALKFKGKNKAKKAKKFKKALKRAAEKEQRKRRRRRRRREEVGPARMLAQRAPARLRAMRAPRFRR